MFQPFRCSFRSITKILGLLLFLGVFGIGTVRSQEASDARPVLDVDGNKVFSKQELLDVANKCLDREAGKSFDTQRLDYCLFQLANHMKAKGYLQARFGKTLYNQTDNVSKATIPVEEGALYRVGEIKIENTKLFAPAQILDFMGLRPGDIADGSKLATGLYGRAKEAYGNFGYIQYTVEVTPTFRLKEGADEGVADFVIEIDEGQQFKIRSIKFAGGDSKTNELLGKELMVRDGEVYNYDLFTKSIARMNNTGLYDRIDVDRDVDYKTNEKAASIDVTINLRKRTASAESQD